MTDNPKELFLVEGKSAASTVRQAMNGQSQSVFALQGKMMNAQSVSQSKIETNAVCAGLFDALGCGVGADCNAENLQFSRILFLTDPDVDGAHARALLAILFSRFLRPLVHTGRVFAVIPPLWRFDPDDGHPAQYAWTDDELAQLRGVRASHEGHARDDRQVSGLQGEVTRFKGVAQFSQAECVQLFLDPITRHQVRLSLGTI